MGRRKLWHERVLASLPAGTLERIKSLVRPREKTTDFIRCALESEIRRRELHKRRKRRI